jgi:hypothetical protein
MGPLGMLGGAAISGYGAFMQNKAEQDMLAANEADRLTAEEEQERLMAKEKLRMDRQILEQFDVKGVMNPRFANGGITGDPIPPPPNGRRWNLADLFRAAPGSQNLLFDEEVQQGYAQLSDEEIQKLIGTAVPMIKDIREADSIGDKIDVARNADLSWVKPLREKAGLSKNDIINKAAEAGMLKSWAKMPVKAAAAFMDFEGGGPTGGPFNVNRMMVPTFPEGVGASAMPSFNFYADGAPVTAQQYAASLPQGQTINDHSQYWMQQLKPQFDNATGTWNNTGQGAMAKRAYGMLQQKELGGPTEGEIRPTPGGINMTTGLSGASNPHEAMIRPDGGMENLLEFIDPTGLSSWDDAYRAYQGMQRDGRYLPNFGEATDMFGAIPLLGKVGKGAKLGAQLLGAAGRGVNLFDTAQDLYSENLAMGGMTRPRYEAEGGEMIQHQANDFPRTYGNGGVSRITPTESKIKGPSHAQGGVDMSDNKGARIYSNKLKVDSALMAKLSKL